MACDGGCPDRRDEAWDIDVGDVGDVGDVDVVGDVGDALDPNAKCSMYGLAMGPGNADKEGCRADERSLAEEDGLAVGRGRADFKPGALRADDGAPPPEELRELRTLESCGAETRPCKPSAASTMGDGRPKAWDGRAVLGWLEIDPSTRPRWPLRSEEERVRPTLAVGVGAGFVVFGSRLVLLPSPPRDRHQLGEALLVNGRRLLAGSEDKLRGISYGGGPGGIENSPVPKGESLVPLMPPPVPGPRRTAAESGTRIERNGIPPSTLLGWASCLWRSRWRASRKHTCAEDGRDVPTVAVPVMVFGPELSSEGPIFRPVVGDPRPERSRSSEVGALELAAPPVPCHC